LVEEVMADTDGIADTSMTDARNKCYQIQLVLEITESRCN
jgi:hypothetical protein